MLRSVLLLGPTGGNILSLYVGRSKRVSWDERNRFTQGIAVPLWTPGDVKSLADAVIRNPAHIAVFVQRPRSPGAQARIVVKLDRDVAAWVSYWAPDLPQVLYT